MNLHEKHMKKQITMLLKPMGIALMNAYNRWWQLSMKIEKKHYAHIFLDMSSMGNNRCEDVFFYV